MRQSDPDHHRSFCSQELAWLNNHPKLTLSALLFRQSITASVSLPAWARPQSQAILLKPKLDLRKHCLDGFEWGYGESGPSQLSLVILADYERRLKDYTLYRDFKFAVFGAVLRNQDPILIQADVEQAIVRIQAKRQTPLALRQHQIQSL